jgi:type II secretory pathway pseudopilin PulG
MTPDSTATETTVSYRIARRRHDEGFTLIDMIFVVGMIGVLATIAMPKLLRAQVAASAASAIGSMRAISSGQLIFALTCDSGFYAPDLATLGIIPPGSRAAFLDPTLGRPDPVIKSGYQLQMTGTANPSSPVSCNGLAAGMGAQAFAATGDPVLPGATPRFFGTNASGAIYEDKATYVGTMPEQGSPPTGVPIH